MVTPGTKHDDPASDSSPVQPIAMGEQRFLGDAHHKLLRELFEVGAQFDAIYKRIVALLDQQMHATMAEVTGLPADAIRSGAVHLLYDPTRGAVTRITPPPTPASPADSSSEVPADATSKSSASAEETSEATNGSAVASDNIEGDPTTEGDQ